jgi:hypothetical protein
MTNINDVGPMGLERLGGRRRGHGYGQIHATDTEKTTAESTEIIYGLGRGGRPRGGGKGNCHAGKNANRQCGRRKRGLRS